MTDDKEMEDMDIWLIARICHEVNRSFCDYLYDDTQVPWDEAPENIQKSAFDGVKFLLDNPNAQPWDSHENWLKFKKEDGWVYGEKKDLEAKTHPCIMSFAELPREQQAKDHLFHAVVRAVEKGVMEIE